MRSSPQGLRRPRFSFFRFSCQTARNLSVPPPERPEGRRSLTLPMQISEAWSPNISEVLRRRTITPRADGAPYPPYIVFNPDGCQPVRPKNAIAWLPPPRSTKSGRPLFEVEKEAAPIKGLLPGRKTVRPPRAPHCGHIHRPFLRFWWEVSIRGYPRQGQDSPHAILRQIIAGP